MSISTDGNFHPPVMPYRALDEHFDAFVQLIADEHNPRGYIASHDAPGTFEELTALLDTGAALVVWNGASSTTIFGSPEVNFAFRAWHDALHYKLRQPFTLPGEMAVALAQVQELRARYSNHPSLRHYCALVLAEIVGQGLYAEINGKFPVNQRLFTKRFVELLQQEYADLPAPRPRSHAIQQAAERGA